MLSYGLGCTRDSVVYVLFSLFCVITSLEVLRVHSAWFNSYFLRAFKLLLRKNEVDRISGTPYYLASTMIAVAFFPKPVAILSILFLAMADPLSSVFGILYGKDKIFENKY